MKFKRARLLWDDIKCLLRGWYFKFTGQDSRYIGELKGWHTISDFSTKIKVRKELKEANSHRISNMKIGCQMINSILIRPGEIFSLRKIIGEADEKRGFKTGPMIVKGELGYATGGGLCQVSTTLFNAVLEANLDILEKHNHSTDIWGENRFIELGRDAVYVYGRKDLKFRNNLNDDIVILFKVDEDALQLVCQILCRQEIEGKVELKSKILQEINPNKNNYGSGWVTLTERFLIKRTGTREKTYKKKEKYKPFWKATG